jgi:hypothetical protein
LADQNFRVKRGLEVGLGATVLTALPSGSVGVGTTNPGTNKLQVQGAIKATSSIDTDTQFLGQPNDTASTPSFSWTSETTTGFYRPSSGNLGFAISGTERLRLNTTGVGIGTTNPSAILDVRGTPWFSPNATGVKATVLRLGRFIDGVNAAYDIITDDNTGDDIEIQSNRYTGNIRISRGSPSGIQTTFQIYSHYQLGNSISIADTTGTTTKIKIDEAGNTFFNNTGAVLVGSATSTGTASQSLQVTGGAYVSTRLGIGQTNPNTALHIGPYNGDTLPHLYLASGNNLYGWRIDTHDFNAGSVPLRIWRRVAGADTESITVLNQSGFIGLGITLPGARLHATPTSTSIAGLFSGTTSDDMVRITQLGTGNALRVEDEANPDSSPFVITGIGSVGIGTTNPIHKLHLNDSTSNQVALALQNSNTGGNSWLLQSSGGSATNGQGKFSIYDTNASQYRLVINSSGDVGIGTTNPTSKLNIVGNVRSTGFSTFTKDFNVVDHTSRYIAYARQLSPQVGTAITTGAVGAGDTRRTDAAIYDYCWDNYSVFDADGDGVVSAADGLVVIRYLFDLSSGTFPGDALITDIVFPTNATRKTSNSIRSHLGIHTLGGTGKLDVSGNGTLTPLGDGLMITRVFAGGFTNPSDNAPAVFGEDSVLYVSRDAKVGIGTTNPITKLHISDGSSGVSTALYTSDYLAISAQNTSPGFNIIGVGSQTGHRGVFKATRARGTLSSPTVPFVDDNTFSLLGAIYDGSSNYATAAINMDVDGDVGVGTAPQRITFWTGTGSSRLERLRLTSTGNFGIGTTNPTSKLTVEGDTLITGILTASASLDGNAFESYEIDLIPYTSYNLRTEEQTITFTNDNDTTTDPHLWGTTTTLPIEDNSLIEDSTFVPYFNGEVVSIVNPFKLMITVNGVLQSAFINNTDYVYQSNILGSHNGYTIDSDNNIKFTESIPTGSDIVARVLPVSSTATKIKNYPFKPTDIVLGY